MLICRQKTKFILHNFLEILQIYCKLIVLVLWTCLATQDKRDTINLSKTFEFICRQKINFIPHASLEILQRYTNLFWVLWASLVAHTQNDSINLYKTLMFICMQKTNFIIHFILEILHFKESCNLIGCSNLRTRILPDMRLVVKYQQQY